jgi:hypothetical protein
MDDKKWQTLKNCSSWTFKEVLSLLVNGDDLSKIMMFSLLPRGEDHALCKGDYAKLAPIYQILERAVDDRTIDVMGNDRPYAFYRLSGESFGHEKENSFPELFWDRLNKESVLLWYQDHKEGIAKDLKKIGRRILFEKELNDLTPNAKTSPIKTEASAFAIPEGTELNEIGVLITSELHIQIFARKKKVKDFTADEWTKWRGMKSKSKNLLLNVLHCSGAFSEENFEGGQKKYLKQYVTILRKELKELFQTEEDPIESKGKGSYQTKFSCTSQLNNPKK